MSKLFILGAGASFGSSLSNCPPLMNGFIAKSKELGIYYNYDHLWYLINKLGYSNSFINSKYFNFEKVFSELQILSSGIWHKNQYDYEHDYGEPFLVCTPVNWLKHFICETLSKTCIEARNIQCSYHDKLCSILDTNDTIVSLNYDTIIDESLLSSNMFNETTGYGFIIYKNKNSFETKQVSNSPVLLLKLHGSLNWEILEEIKESENSQMHRRNQSIRYRLNKLNDFEVTISNVEEIEKRHPLDYMDPSKPQSNLEFKHDFMSMGGLDKFFQRLIVPPTFSKTDSLNSSIFDSIWHKFRESLLSARQIYFIGTSFPDTDYHLLTMIKFYLNSRNDNFELFNINPDSRYNLEQNSFSKLQTILPNKNINNVALELDKFVSNL